MQLETYFWDQFESKTKTVALVDEAGKTMSYEELAEKANEWEQVYRKLWPTEETPQLLIAIAIVPNMDVVAAYFGALRAGHAVLLTDVETLHPDHQIQTIYKPNIIVQLVDGACEAYLGDVEPVKLHPDLRVLLSTSGTTGAPKLVRLSNENIHANAVSIASYLNLNPSERALTSLPLHYSYGLSVLHAHLASGGSLLLTEESITSKRFWNLFKDMKATSLALVPHQFDLLETIKFHQMKLPNLNYITQAGGKLSAQKVKAFAEIGRRDGWKLFVMYGQTEASPRMAYIPPDDVVEHSDTIGRAIPSGELSLRNETGEIIREINIAGELYYHGPNVMMGYGETRADLALGSGAQELATGDIALRTEKNYFKIIGRKKRFVKLFGLRLSLDQMEQLLSKSGFTAFCMSVDDCLVILHKENAVGDEIVSKLCDEYSLPRNVMLTEVLRDVPLMSSGKIDYSKLKYLAEEAVASSEEVTNSDKSEPSPLLSVIKRATRAKEVSEQDSFSGLGGDSLAYIEVTLAIEDELGYVPDNWEEMSIAEIQRLKPNRSVSGKISADVLVRLIAVTLIVVNHAARGLWSAGGGTWILLIIVGYSFARFSRSAVINRTQFKSIIKLLYPIIPLYYLILIGVILLGRYVEPSMILLTNNLGSKGSGFLVSPNWFVSLYVQVLIGTMIVLSIPFITRKMTRNSWLLGLYGLAISLIGSIAFQIYVHPYVLSGATREELSFIVRSPFVCMPFVVVGWMIFCAEERRQKWITAGAIVACALLFPGPEPYYSFTIALGGLLLLSEITVEMPRFLSTILRTAAATTLFVYLLHAIPVHIFNFGISSREELGIPAVALLSTISAFLLGYIAKRAFDIIDEAVLFIYRSYIEPRRGRALK